MTASTLRSGSGSASALAPGGAVVVAELGGEDVLRIPARRPGGYCRATRANEPQDRKCDTPHCP